MLHRSIRMRELGKRIGFGLIGGAIGLVVMEAVRRGTKPLVKRREPQPMDVFATARSMSPFGVHHDLDEASTSAVGRMAYQKLVGRPPSKEMKRALSWAVHIGYGLAVAALYGAFRGESRHVVRDGALFGTALWLVGDEIAVPLLGLADKPTAYHPTQHLQSFAQHIGFGVGTAAATQLLEEIR
jgi:hypothetical protein